MAEILPDALYDYERPVKGLKEILFFQRPVDVNGRGYEDTNMHLVGSVPFGVAVMVHSLEVQFIPRGFSREDYRAVAASGQLRFVILNKIYVDQYPLGTVMRPWELHNITENGQASESIPWVTGPWIFQLPLALLPSQSFSVEIQWREGFPVDGGRLGVVLKGFRRRGAV